MAFLHQNHVHSNGQSVNQDQVVVRAVMQGRGNSRLFPAPSIAKRRLLRRKTEWRATALSMCMLLAMAGTSVTALGGLPDTYSESRDATGIHGNPRS